MDVTTKSYTIQLTGTKDKLDAFVEAVKEESTLLEIVRSGLISLSRGEKKYSLMMWKVRLKMTALLKIGLVSVSDRASSGVYQDQGIPELQQWLEQALVDPFEVETRLIPDEQHIEQR